MCMYDYTPYTGCEHGPQHYYLQWVKCGVAVENGRYCSVDTSTRAEQLQKLSANVLSCPLHGPIAVQQFVLDSANARQLDEEVEKPRARSTTRRSATPRGRTPKRASDRDAEHPVRREVRKQRSRRSMAPETSDSESSSSLSSRPKAAAGRARRSGARDVRERQGRGLDASSHRRSTSADVSLRPPPPLSMRHGRSEVSLPLQKEPEAQATSPPARPKTSLDIPRAIGVIGLPSSPDMHRRGSADQSRSEGVSKTHTDPLPAPRSAVSPASDSSPDQNPDLPFSSPGRRGRRTAARSVRDRSVDTTMRRIDEHVASGEPHDIPGAARIDTSTPESRTSSTTTMTTTRTSPEPQYTTTAAATTSSHVPHNRRSNSRPHLNTLEIPKNQQPHPQRDAYSAPTATPPETDITTTPTTKHTLRGRAKSLRHIDISPLAPPPPSSSHQTEKEAAASIHTTSSSHPRRPEDQATKGQRRAAAREHVASHTPTPNLPGACASGVPSLGGRESVDSGYLSGQGHHHHQAQQSWDAARSTTDLSLASAAAGGKGARKTLVKAPPPSLPLPLPQERQQQQQQSGEGVGLGLGVLGLGEEDARLQKAKPAALNLGGGNPSGLPLCALPVSLVSPGFRSDVEVVSPGGKGRATLLQRMGLKRKISGLLWDRGGQREVGVEG